MPLSILQRVNTHIQITVIVVVSFELSSAAVIEELCDLLRGGVIARTEHHSIPAGIGQHELTLIVVMAALTALVDRIASPLRASADAAFVDSSWKP
jgi:hypothetical protein